MDTLERMTDLWQETRPPNVFVTKEKPDVWILPEKSVIVEVRFDIDDNDFTLC
jgi:ATP-dependent DNA ligase